MTKSAAITAQVVDICNDRQHKGSIKITLHVPVEVGARLTEILGWPTHTTPVPVALARLNESAVVADAPAVNLSPSHAPAAGATNRLTKRAAILSNDALFQKYLNECTNSVNYTGASDLAAMYIRHHCSVESRKDIRPGTEAAARFDRLDSSFVAWRDKDVFVEP